MVFVEDYDMALARYLVQGCDVWLNTPVRLSEASGTSGMKATANGVLNLSMLDGWWDEAYQPEAGWAIGHRETYADPTYRDQIEAQTLYDLLEREVVPLFYERTADNLPRRWITQMKNSVRTLCPHFTTHRMVGQYTEEYYMPAAECYRRLTSDGQLVARSLAAWRARVEAAWPRVRIERVAEIGSGEIQVGTSWPIEATIVLGTLAPDDVTVELCLGPVDSGGNVTDAETTPMRLVRSAHPGSYVYQADAPACRRSGLHGYTVRVLPCHPDLATPFVPGLIAWA
jgi:starch phosphorylase